jgi:hypothetical protein
MLPSVSDLNNKILALRPTTSEIEGVTQFVKVIADFMNQMQAGSVGMPGIFTYNNAVAIALLQVLPEVADNSWIIPFANAIHAGSSAASLSPGTVTNPAWTASLVDVLPPVNTGLAAALPVLISGLQKVTSLNNPAMPMAQAISDYAKAFIFLVTGLVLAPPGPPIPLPLPFPAK